MKRLDYNAYISSFKSADIESHWLGSLDAGLNVCEEICDRHAASSRIGLRYKRINDNSGEKSFAELQQLAARFANFLSSQGIGRGDRVACMLPRTPELLIVVLGTLRIGAVYQPLFTAFGSGAIDYRLKEAQARMIITNTEHWPKLDRIHGLPTTLLVADQDLPCNSQADFIFGEVMAAASLEFEPVRIGRDEPFLQMFTSGTTGKAKGVAVPVKALVSFWVYMQVGLDLREEDNFWNVADPGWAYGLYYAVIGPLLLGRTTHFNEHTFTAEDSYAFIQDFSITNLAAAPTVYRLLMASEELIDNYDVSLRVASSAGEPLNPEVVHWMARVFDCPVRDQYGQTETGMTACNFHALEHPERDASMGFPMPGYRLVVLDEQFREVDAGETGQLAIDIAYSPQFFFMDYSSSDKKPFNDNYYLTGDTVIHNGDGSFSYTGRDDDLITSAGYRIGPADVENTLLEYPAVIESAVVGKPDKKRGAIVKAYIVLREGEEQTQALVENIQEHVRIRLSTHSYPREIEFLDELPKTPSGKLQRFLLRQRAADTG